MKLTISPADLKAAARFVTRMAPSRPTQPILSGVHIHADPARGVTFSVNDYERTAQTTAEATIDEGGTILVNLRLLAAIADKLAGDNAQLMVEDHALTVKSGRARYVLPLMPVAEYPVVNHTDEPVAVFDASVFEDAIARVVPATSSDDVTPILGGVHVVVGEQVTFTATDRYRVATISVPADISREADLVIPGTLLGEAAKSFTGRITVSTAANDAVVIRGDQGVMSSLPIVGNYPPVERLLTMPDGGRAVVDSGLLLAAVGRVQVVADREQPLVFTFGDDSLLIAATGGENAASEPVECESESAKVALKPQFVTEGVKACRAEQVRVQFTNPNSNGKPGPVLFEGTAGFRYLLQPNLLVQ